MMKKRVLALGLTLMMGLGLAACSSQPQENGSSGVEEDNGQVALGTLVMGTSADYPPFEFHTLTGDKDLIVGLDVFLAEEIALDLGAELEIRDMEFDLLLNLMNKGDIDIVVAAMEYKADRGEAADYSEPYYTDEAPLILVKKENADQYQSLDDFTGKIVGAQSGTTKVDIVLGTDPEKPHMTGVQDLQLAKVTDLVGQLMFDKCDAVVLDAAVARKYAEANPDLAIVEGIDLGDAAEPYRVWVAKGDPKGLLPSINQTIAKVTQEGGMMADFIETANELAAEGLASEQ